MCSSLHFETKNNENHIKPNQTKPKQNAEWEKSRKKEEKRGSGSFIWTPNSFSHFTNDCACVRQGKCSSNLILFALQLCTNPYTDRDLMRLKFKYICQIPKQILLGARSPNQITEKHSIE